MTSTNDLFADQGAAFAPPPDRLEIVAGKVVASMGKPSAAQKRFNTLMARIDAELPAAVASLRPLAPPRLGRVSRRVRSFPVAPHVELRPDEKAQHWLLAVSASDRTGLLYSIARVLAAHAISVELAKVTTLGERVEDVFLLRGEQLQQERTRVSIEQELLQALEPS